jgi:hypothetical protein
MTFTSKVLFNGAKYDTCKIKAFKNGLLLHNNSQVLSKVVFFNLFVVAEPLSP